jgi:hypothetical protein
MLVTAIHKRHVVYQVLEATGMTQLMRLFERAALNLTSCAPAAAAAAAPALHQMNNPLHLWQVWRGDVRLQRSCLAKHNAIMDTKMDRIMTQPPPDYTIAGTMHFYLECFTIIATSQTVSLPGQAQSMAVTCVEAF